MEIRACNLKYQAAAGENVIVATGKCIPERIIFGADVAASVIEVSDSEDNGDGAIRLKLAGATLMTSTGGELEVGALFENGITADIVNQTDVTFVWRPTA